MAGSFRGKTPKTKTLKTTRVPVCAWGKECLYALSGQCRFRHTSKMLGHFEKKRELVREEQRWRREHRCVHCKLGRCRYREICRWRLSSDSEYSSGEEEQGEVGAEQCRGLLLLRRTFF